MNRRQLLHRQQIKTIKHRKHLRNQLNSNNCRLIIVHRWAAIQIFSWKPTNKRLISVRKYLGSFFQFNFKNPSNVHFFIKQIQTSLTWVACLRCMLHRQFLQAVITDRISKINSRRLAQYFQHIIWKAMTILPVTHICESFWATTKTPVNSQSKFITQKNESFFD